MSRPWLHFLWIIALGYALGYWMPKLGDMTLGKIYSRG
jgi:hypothetical protein